MTLQEVARIPFILVAITLLYYSNAVFVSTLILTGLAVGAFHHPAGASIGDEVLVFLLNWLLSVFVCFFATHLFARNPLRFIEFERHLVTVVGWKTLSVHNAMTFFASLVVAAALYIGTELIGYDKSGMHRLQSLAFVWFVMTISLIYDQYSGKDGYHLLGALHAREHVFLTAVMSLLILVDTCVQLPNQIWLIATFFGVWLLIRLFEYMTLPARPSVHQKVK